MSEANKTKLEPLSPLVWQCYPLTDGMERDECREDSITVFTDRRSMRSWTPEDIKGRPDIWFPQDGVEELSLPEMKNRIFHFLNDVYIVKALENLDSNEYAADFKEAANQELRSCADEYSDLLLFNYFFHEEVQKAIDRINIVLDFSAHELTHVTSDQCSQLREELNRLYSVRPLSKDGVLFSDLWFKKFFDSLIAIVKSEAYRDELEHIAERILGQPWEHPYGRVGLLRLYIEFFYVLHRVAKSLTGEMIWLLFLISLSEYGMGQSNGRVEQNPDIIQLLNNWIRDWKRKLQQTIEPEIIAKQYKLMCFFVSHSDEERILRKELHVVTCALKKVPKLRKEYVDHKRHRCIAVMRVDAIKYVALSGYSIPGKKLLTALRPELPQYTIAELSEDTRYYFDKDPMCYITLAEYEKSACAAVNDLSAQMFSCCERKLLTMLYDGTVIQKVRIYVKLKPCKVCRRAIEARSISMDDVHSLKKYHIGQKKLKSDDSSARKVWEEVKAQGGFRSFWIDLNKMKHKSMR